MERQPRIRLSVKLWLYGLLVLLLCVGGLVAAGVQLLHLGYQRHTRTLLDARFLPTADLVTRALSPGSGPPGSAVRGTLDQVSPAALDAWILDLVGADVLDHLSHGACTGGATWPDDLPGRARTLGVAEGRVRCSDGREYLAKAQRLHGEARRPWGLLVVAGVDVSEARQAWIHGDRRLFLGAAAAAVLLGALLLLPAARDLTRALPGLMEASRHLALGDFDHRTPVETRDELGILALTLNEAAATLKLNRRRLQRAGQIQAWHQVARQVAHEIKNPLTGMRAAAENLRRATGRDPEVLGEAARECSEVVAEEVDALHRLAEAFSSLARLPEPQPTDLDLNHLVLHVVSLTAGGEGSRAEMVTDLEEDLPPVHADETQLGQVLKNLLKNAREALPQDGRIVVSTRRQGERAEVRVEDSGPGVPEASRERIFEPFVTTKEGGSGIGLALSRQIAEAHGGTLALCDSSEGGAGFLLTLPLEDLESKRPEAPHG